MSDGFQELPGSACGSLHYGPNPWQTFYQSVQMRNHRKEIGNEKLPENRNKKKEKKQRTREKTILDAPAPMFSLPR